MELAAAFDAKSGGVIVAAITALFTIGYVTNRLGEDEDWLSELSIDMFPEDGCLRLYGVGEDGVTAFTRDGIECLRQIIADQRVPAAHRRRSYRPNSPARGAHRMETDLLGPPKIRIYLLHLTQERHLAASSVIVTVSAFRFFYHTTLKRPWVVEDDIPAGRQAKKLPVVLSQDEVARFLGAVDNLKHRVILTVCYVTGLCGGRMIIIEIFERGRAPRYRPTVSPRIDSS